MKQGLAKMFLASVEVGILCTKIRNNEKTVSADILVDYRAPGKYLSHDLVHEVEQKSETDCGLTLGHIRGCELGFFI